MSLITRPLSVKADEHRQIHQACREAGELDIQQADAVSARIALDLRIGAAFTRLTTMTLQSRAPELASSVISYGELSCSQGVYVKLILRSMPISHPRLRRRSIQPSPSFRPGIILVHLRRYRETARRPKLERNGGHGIQMEEESPL